MKRASVLTHRPALAYRVGHGVEVQLVASQRVGLHLHGQVVAAAGAPFHTGRIDLLNARACGAWARAAARAWDGVRDDALPIGADAFVATLRSLALTVHATHDRAQGPAAAHGQRARAAYAIRDGRICRLHGDSCEPLCNFAATIRREVVVDDGAAERGELEIEGTLEGGEPLGTARVALGQFARMDWVLAQWGTRACMNAGMGTRDQVRAAIQVLSVDAVRTRVYGHSGWCRLADGWAWLHAGGAIGATVSHTLGAVHVALEGTLQQVRLPAHPWGAALTGAIQASLNVLEVAPDPVSIPLLAATYRAPLAEALPVDVSIFLAGQTGTFKSELTALAQAHYGAGFTRLTLPAQWTSTGNALERLAFAAKDCLLVIDDFAPHGSAVEVARLHATAERVFRGAGNHAGRSRMAADGTLRPDYPPRGLILASGEDVPTGHSLAARLLVVQVAPDEVRVSALTRAQQAAQGGRYAAALTGYLAWLAPQLDTLRLTLPRRLAELRVQLGGWHAHRRTPDAVASLLIAWELWVRFAVQAGALTEQQAAALLQRVRATLLAVGAAQVATAAERSPAQQFIELLGAALAGQRAHLVTPQGGRPEHPDRWGWRPLQRAEWDPQTRRTVERVDWLPAPGSRLIGWVGPGEHVYLQPDSAYAAAQQLAGEKRESLAVGEKTLWKRLHDAGMLASVDSAEGKHLIRRTIGEHRRYVLHMHAHLLCTPCVRETGVSGGTESHRPATREDDGLHGPQICPSAADVPAFQRHTTGAAQGPVPLGGMADPPAAPQTPHIPP
jgi:hypothetical protein